MPHEIEANKLRKAVYDATDPKLTPVFEELQVPEGTGRLIVMQIYPGLPLTPIQAAKNDPSREGLSAAHGTVRHRVMVETGRLI